MNKRLLQTVFRTLPIAVAGTMIAVMIFTFSAIRDSMTATCFKALEGSAHRLVVNFATEIEHDKAVLRAMASIMASRESLAWENIRDTMALFDNTTSYVSHVELLTPNGHLLHQNGTTINVGGRLSFDVEATQGIALTNAVADMFDPTDRVLKSSMPISRNGAVIGVLYGVISLKQLAKQYKADEYGGKAFVYIVDGDTGDFLLDTWHKTAGNIADFNKRKTLYGYDYASLPNDLREGQAGRIAFISRTTGTPLYLHYMPMGIKNWNLMVSVVENVAFANFNSVNNIYLKMMIFEIGALLSYIIYLIVHFFKVNRQMATEALMDATTRLQNRNAFQKRVSTSQNTLFGSIACCYLDANGLHEINNNEGHDAGDAMLRTVAGCLQNVFPYKDIYRIGGDEFVVFCEGVAATSCQDALREFTSQVQQHNYSVSTGMSMRESERGLERVIKEADTEMLKNKFAHYAKNDRRRHVRETA